MAGTINLAISGGNSIDIYPLLGSDRYKPNRVISGEQTARGISTLKGITARDGLFVWKLDIWLYTWELLKLEEIIELQQTRFKANNSAGVVTLSDQAWHTNSVAITQSGRTPLDSAVTFGGISGRYCAFGVELQKGEGFSQTLRMLDDLTGREKITLIAREL